MEHNYYGLGTMGMLNSWFVGGTLHVECMSLCLSVYELECVHDIAFDCMLPTYCTARHGCFVRPIGIIITPNQSDVPCMF